MHYQRVRAWSWFILRLSFADLGMSPLLLAPTLLAPGPENVLDLRDRAPPFDPTLLGLSRTMTRVRHSHGTRRFSLTVASFRTWRSWQVYAAWDPAFYIIIRDIGPWTRSGGGIQPRYSGLRVQGTASSPPSTASIDHGRLRGPRLSMNRARPGQRFFGRLDSPTPRTVRFLLPVRRARVWAIVSQARIGSFHIGGDYPFS